MTTQVAKHTNRRSIAPDFLQKVLRPYLGFETDYLKSAELQSHCNDDSFEIGDPIFKMKGHYEINDSCYIQSTGHFNAAEFIMCFNQLAYLSIAETIKTRCFSDTDFQGIKPTFKEKYGQVSEGDFFEKQLSSMLIIKSDMTFKRPIHAASFYAELSINRVFYRQGTFFADTICVFNDHKNGHAEGSILMAYSPKVAG
jgi:hypothetical protein